MDDEGRPGRGGFSRGAVALFTWFAPVMTNDTPAKWALFS